MGMYLSGVSIRSIATHSVIVPCQPYGQSTGVSCFPRSQLINIILGQPVGSDRIRSTLNV